MTAIGSAETAGAAQIPQAALHLKLAQDQIAQAKQMQAAGDDERADALSLRASADAELALALAREDQAVRDFETYSRAAQGPLPAEPAPSAPSETQLAPGPDSSRNPAGEVLP